MDPIDEVRTALQGPDARIALVETFTHGRAAQVYVKSRKVGPLLFPPEGGGLEQLLGMLGCLAAEPVSKS